jgi:uncharacterized repeat protein (TIGR01451 family)
MKKLAIVVFIFLALVLSLSWLGAVWPSLSLSIGEGTEYIEHARPAPSFTSEWLASSIPLNKAHQHLAEVMDSYHQSFDVYTDMGAAGNHFIHRAREYDVTLNGAFTRTVHSGCTAISNTFSAHGTNWGEWYFQNGVLLADDVGPRDNWGDYPDAGFDLTGATQLTFWARGEQGGERVEFFAFGVGRDPGDGSPISLYPDSEAKVTLCGRLASPCYITLEDTWRPYTITLTGLDLSYVIGGFGWVTNAPENNGQSITFYLDDIRYDKPHLNDLRFLVSYQTLCTTQDFDTILQNVAFTYNNALALIAFVASEDKDRGEILADALVYVQAHDRYYDDGRLRNAYQAGDLIIPPGWTPNGRVDTARMPGWWDPQEQEWYEEEEFVGSGTGNLAWTMIALLDYYDKWGGEVYLNAAIDLGNWLENHTRDTRGAGGYTGGYIGWEPNPTPLLWKSTEHNLDLYVAFERLYRITGEQTWHERAEHARNFVNTMWNDTEGLYWTGTRIDGMTVNTQTVPLDAQTLSLLTLGPNERTQRAIDYAEAHHRATYGDYEGFDFNDDRDMPWFEGTGQMVVAYWMLGDTAQAQFYLNELRKAQETASNGDGKGIVAAPADGLTTGFDWEYFNRLHVGATAWFIFAELGYNPYWGNLVRDVAIVKSSQPSSTLTAGAWLTYTIHVTNTGIVTLTATITDTLPTHVTTGETAGGTTVLPGRKLVWTPIITAPWGVWVRTVVVTVEMGYVGPLTNVVEVTTKEGATGVYTETSHVIARPIYLPLVMRNY